MHVEGDREENEHTSQASFVALKGGENEDLKHFTEGEAERGSGDSRKLLLVLAQALLNENSPHALIVGA